MYRRERSISERKREGKKEAEGEREKASNKGSGILNRCECIRKESEGS